MCNFIKPSQEKKVELQTKFNNSNGETAGSGRQKATTFRLARHHYSLAVLSLDGYLTAPIPIDVARRQNCYPGRVLHADKYLLFDTSGKSDAWRKKNPGILLIKAPENACIKVRDEYMKLQSIGSEASRLANEASENRLAREAEERPQTRRQTQIRSANEEAQEKTQTRRQREEQERQEYMKLQSMDSAEASRLAIEASQNLLAKKAEERHQRMQQREEEKRLIERERQEAMQQRQEEEDQRRTPAQWRALLAAKDTELASKLAAKDTELASKSAQILSLEIELGSVKRRLEEISTSKKKATDALRYNEEKSKDDQTSLVERIGLANDATITKLKTLIAKAGGLSRLTLTSAEFHEQHSKDDNNAAFELFGYRSYQELKEYIDAYFHGEVDVNEDRLEEIEKLIDAKDNFIKLSPYERCLCCRMFIRCFPKQKIMSLIFDRHRTTIGDILKEWMPKWANIGQDLGCLDITLDYLQKELPEYNEARGSGLSVFVDGKDFSTGTKDSDTNVARSTFSTKKEGDAVRVITFSTATGLVCEKSPEFAGRAGERMIVKYMGSRGPVNADTRSWEDVYSRDPFNPRTDDVFYTPLDDYLNSAEYAELVDELAENGEGAITTLLEAIGAHDDGILLTAERTGLARGGITADDESSVSDESTGEVVEQHSARNVFSIADGKEAYMNMVKMAEVDRDQKKKRKRKSTPLLTPDKLKEQNERALESDPNMSGKRKLKQLELHQRLHQKYQAGKLRKCMLSYFLLSEEQNRLKLLAWMGSPLAGNTPKPTFEELPKIPLGLAKIPEGVSLAGDKGFTGLENVLPNLNQCENPAHAKSAKERQSEEQIVSEVPLTSKRAVCETVFKRVVLQALLREKIPYYLIPWIPHASSLAHGEVNLNQPSRRPGRGAIVGDDYWNNVIDYRLIERDTVQSKNVEESSNRLCHKCNGRGITLHCQKCKRWFHEDCHDFGNCAGRDPNNPYDN